MSETQDMKKDLQAIETTMAIMAHLGLAAIEEERMETAQRLGEALEVVEAVKDSVEASIEAEESAE